MFANYAPTLVKYNDTVDNKIIKKCLYRQAR